MMMSFTSPKGYAGVVANSWLHSLVLIEKKVGDDFEPEASGFLTTKKDKKHFILITNEHVIKSNINNLPLFVRLSKKKEVKQEKKFQRIPLMIKKERFAIDSKSDLAAFYLFIPNKYDPKNLHVSPISFKSYLTFNSVPLGDEVFLVGFPTSIQKINSLQKNKNLPILRGGIISAKFQEDDTNFILIDAPSYWGNSGGPVFIKPRLFNINHDGNYEVPPESAKITMFIGVVSSMMTATRIWGKYKDEDTGEEKELASAWHSGLSTVIPADYILKLLDELPDIDE